MPMLIVEGHSQFLIPSTTTWLLAQQLHSPLQQQKIQNGDAPYKYKMQFLKLSPKPCNGSGSVLRKLWHHAVLLLPLM